MAVQTTGLRAGMVAQLLERGVDEGEADDEATVAHQRRHRLVSPQKADGFALKVSCGTHAGRVGRSPPDMVGRAHGHASYPTLRATR